MSQMLEISADFLNMQYMYMMYCHVPNINYTQSPNPKLVLKFSLCNILKSGVKLRIKM